MEPRQPSRTALATAAARAAHLIVDREPWILEDRLAASLLGERADELVAVHRNKEMARGLASMRVAMTARSRYTEDRLVEALDRGVSQYVLLGAGLDSFAYRSPLAERCRVFEVDHPSSQASKRQQLATASIAEPSTVRYVAVDFAADSLSDRLGDAGFDRSQPAFVSWLGVTQYLTDEAINATLDTIAGLASGTELVMEYLVPAELRDEEGQAGADFFMPRAAAFGEPWVTFISPTETSRLLTIRDMIVIEDVGRKDQIASSLWRRSDSLCPHELGRLARAVVAGG